PKKEPLQKKLPQSVFFPYRTSQISIETVGKLLSNCSISRMHFHLIPDPGGRVPELDRSLFSNCREITYSGWLNTEESYNTELETFESIISPRIAEGIGMTFLEAMSKGICVIAANRPTMNEYIRTGQNGILFDPTVVMPLEKGLAWKDLGLRGYRDVVKGFEEFSKRLDELDSYILSCLEGWPRNRSINRLKLYSLVCRSEDIGRKVRRGIGKVHRAVKSML
ncbi:MAG: glycosyltransferase, partial [Spirochaetia bacterium]